MQLGRDLEEAGQVAGARWLDVMRHIVVPVIKPALLSVALLVFISAVRDVSVIALLSSHYSRTLSLLIIDHIYGDNVGSASVLSIILVVIAVGASLAYWRLSRDSGGA